MGISLNQLPEDVQQKVREQMGAKSTARKRAGGGGGPPTKPNKYGAQPTVSGGIRYDSKLEAERAEALELMRAAGDVWFFIGQPKFRLGVPENVYVADFLVLATPDASPAYPTVWVEDVKGRETTKFRRDKRLWARYGPCELHIITRQGVEVIHPPDAKEKP